MNHFSFFDSSSDISSSSISQTCRKFVDEKRGFVPSDISSDPSKKEFLLDLSKRILNVKNKETGREIHFKNNTFSSSQLSKILTPSSDDGSLKRRNPHQMYTDSAFYNPKHHPSVAEQVEMAHRLSSSLYDEGNKKSHGQEMFLKRAKKSDLSSDEEVFPLHDRVPNMKLVMNPEGKIHDWSDLPEDEIPDIKNRCALGTTAEVAQFVIENLEQCKGRGNYSKGVKGVEAPSKEILTPCLINNTLTSIPFTERAFLTNSSSRNTRIISSPGPKVPNRGSSRRITALYKQNL